MSNDPFQVVRDFEAALCEYTGAMYAVTTTSCTMAILIAGSWQRAKGAAEDVQVPRRTYVGVPASLRSAGFKLSFSDEDWQGEYQIRGTTIFDSARRFTSAMHRPGYMQCVSFHTTKILGLANHGGAILHDWPGADAWLRRARFDGRTEGVPAKDDQVQYPSWHCYMTPATAAEGLMRLAILPKHNADLPKSDYPDCSKLEAFK